MYRTRLEIHKVTRFTVE